jgi:LysR family nitrogen assimilation transcriptional regulator
MAMAGASLKPKVDLEIDSVPAMLDLVQRLPLHAVLSLNAIHGSGQEATLAVRPIRVGPEGTPLTTRLWIATSALRPRGPLLDQAVLLLAELLGASLGSAAAKA